MQSGIPPGLAEKPACAGIQLSGQPAPGVSKAKSIVVKKFGAA
jgi:hypothetical protein